MTKQAALHKFFNSFGAKAYPADNVPDNVSLPYIDYESKVGAFDSGEIAIAVNLFCYTSKEAEPNAIVQKISERIGIGGCTIPCDGGFIWLKRGSPWCQTVVESSDTNVKRRYINISAEFMTAD